MPSHILVIGATGQTGIDFCSAALKANHRLTLYVRNPSKVPASISSNANVTVVEGQLSDEGKLAEVVGCGASVFVSFAGPVYSSKGTPVTDCLRFVFPQLIAHSYERALILGTPSFHAPGDADALKWRLCVTFIKLVARDAYKEFKGLGAVVASQDVNFIKWTLFRVPFLGNGNAKPVKATFTGKGDDGMFLSRQSMADWVLTEIQGGEWIGKCPLLCN